MVDLIRNIHTSQRCIRRGSRIWAVPLSGRALLYVHRNRRLIRDGSPATATSTFTQLLALTVTTFCLPGPFKFNLTFLIHLFKHKVTYDMTVFCSSLVKSEQTCRARRSLNSRKTKQKQKLNSYRPFPLRETEVCAELRLLANRFMKMSCSNFQGGSS